MVGERECKRERERGGERERRKKTNTCIPFLYVCFASFADVGHVSDVANEVETV